MLAVRNILTPLPILVCSALLAAVAHGAEPELVIRVASGREFRGTIDATSTAEQLVLRATNDGITATIDPAGRMRGTLPLYVEGTSYTGFSYISEHTVYTRWGDWFALLCATVVVMGLVALNIAAFGLELWLGGSESPRILYRLGAMWPPAIMPHGQWWRLVTASFLHFGPVHLAFNMLTLVVVGLWVEAAIGHWRTLVVYLLAGIGSSAAVLLMVRHGWLDNQRRVDGQRLGEHRCFD